MDSLLNAARAVVRALADVRMQGETYTASFVLTRRIETMAETIDELRKVIEADSNGDPHA